jgi:YD repeat-containing protein
VGQNQNLKTRTRAVTIRRSYDERRNPVSYEVLEGGVSQALYQFRYHPDFNLVTQVMGPEGHVTDYEYDSQANLTLIRVHAAGG